MTEQWKPVVGYEGYYEVSSEGRIRSIATGRNRLTGRMLKTSSDADGYQVLNLSRDGKQRQHKLHRIVATAFHGQSDLFALHGDGNPGNNRASNLRWGTPLENIYDRRRHGTARNQNTGKVRCKRGHELTEDNVYIYEYRSGKQRHCKACVALRKVEEARLIVGSA